MPVDEIRELTEADVRRRLDEGARKRLGISGDELIEKYRTGKLDDCGKHADLLALADLLID
jgi:hypothetical protein